MAGYTKLFNSILDSTIWQEANETRLLWITMLAMSDLRGEVQASVPGLAKRAGIPLDKCKEALQTLAGPDEYSRTKDFDGRRIREIDGGWALLNHGRYRALMSKEERTEYNRRKKAEERSRKRGVNDMSMTVNDSQQCQHISDTDTDTDTEAGGGSSTPALEIAEKELDGIQPFKSNRHSTPHGKEPPDRWKIVADYLSAEFPEKLKADYDGTIRSVQKFFLYFEEDGWSCKDWKIRLRRWLLEDSQPKGRKSV